MTILRRCVVLALVGLVSGVAFVGCGSSSGTPVLIGTAATPGQLTSLEIVGISPTADKTNIPTNSKIRVTFAGPVNLSTLNSSTLRVIGSSGQDIPGLISYNSANNEAAFAPTTAFSAAESIVVFVAGVETPSGSKMSRSYTSRFTTGNGADTLAPTFGGLVSATADSVNSLHLQWNDATDDFADPVADIYYRVYYSTVSGGQIYTSPNIQTTAGITFLDQTGFQPQTTYYFVVRAVDTAGNEDSNVIEKSVTTPAMPDTVSPVFSGTFTATAAGPSAITLNWTAASDNKTAASAMVYDIYQGSSTPVSTSGAPTKTSAPGAITESITGLTQGTLYFFVIVARDGAGNTTTHSTTASATTDSVADTTAPTFTSAVSATATGNSAINVSWSAASDDISPASAIVYQVFQGTASPVSTAGAPAVTTQAGATSTPVTGLTANTQYFFAVVAMDQAGNKTANSNEANATTLNQADSTPPTFAGLSSATATQGGAINLSWNAATDDTDASSAIVYRVYRATSSGGQNFTSPLSTTTAGTTTYSDSSVTGGTTYYYVVRAVDSAGNEDANTVEKSATVDNTAPTFAGATSATAQSDTAIQVSWTAATDNVDTQAALQYNIYTATTSGGQAFVTPSAVSSHGATSHNVGGLNASTQYFFVVRAVDSSGNEDTNTVEVNATTQAPPGGGGGTGVSFANDVLPLLSDGAKNAKGQACNSSGCHQNIAGFPVGAAGSYDLTTYANVTAKDVTAGNKSASKLYKYCTSPTIPGSSGSSKHTWLADSSKTTIGTWIDEGAKNN